jgi:hypothetical protein
MTSNNYNIKVKCEDAAGNIANGETSFNLDIDTSAPKIVRFYNDNGNLYIYTAENSDCSFSNKNCNFLFENGTSMNGGFNQEHYTDWNVDKTYYIKCRDIWENEQGCLKIKAYNEVEQNL